jgi:choloylglycine hydrolase
MDVKKHSLIGFLLVPVMLFSAVTTSSACTRILRVDKEHAVMAGRTLDWNDDLKTNMAVYPRGIEHKGTTEENPVSWTSLYGSLVVTAYDQISHDGMNEAGLAGHLLWLNASDYGKRDSKSVPGLSVAMWLQYYLDKFKTVDEAVKYTQANHFQITPVFHPIAKRWVTVHLVLDDATGDSAIFEYSNGKLQIFHDNKNLTATNDPTYDKQLQNLKEYKVFGGDKPLPGTTLSADRFVRAQFYTQTLPKAASIKEELAQVMSVLSNASQPYMTYSSDNPFESKTYWQVVADLTNRIYYYQSTEEHNLLFVKLEDFNLKPGAPIMKLDLVNHPDYVGNVTAQFEPLVRFTQIKAKTSLG